MDHALSAGLRPRDGTSRRGRRVGGSLLAVLCLARPAIADPDPEPGRGGLSIVWDAPQTCPDVAHLRATVASMLAGSTLERSVLPLAASGTVTQAEGLYHLRVQLDSNGASETKTM